MSMTVGRSAARRRWVTTMCGALLILSAARSLPASAASTATDATTAPAAAWPEAARVDVDAREAPRGIMTAHLMLPVAEGALTLVYPKWLPGRHSPAGPATSLGGLKFTAAGHALAWRRDPVDLYAFHLNIPPGVERLDVDLEILTAPAPDGVVQGLETPRTATDSLLILEWNQLVLYPARSRSDDLVFQASVRLPAGWTWAAALDTASGGKNGNGSGSGNGNGSSNGNGNGNGNGSGYGNGSGSGKVSGSGNGKGNGDGDGDGGELQFAPVSLTTLVDSTLLAGRYMRTIPLGGTPAVTLHLAADTPVALGMSAETQAHYRRLVREAAALFGATHYDRYEFLWALTDQIMPDGLEHHQSSDDRSPLRALIDDPIRRAEANLLPHEYVHSWNGKYRRPQGLATPDYQAPMIDALLWVYEGLTEYLGDVLAARSGLLTGEELRGEFAHDAAAMQSHRGREWRPLQDTTDAAPLLYYQSRSWAARLRRQEDFYQESALLWLEADTLIRRESKGRRSLDDFCRLFYGAPSTGPRVVPYDFDAVVAALAAVWPHDWAGFWQERLTRLRAAGPLEGLQSSGWRLALDATPSLMHAAHEADDKDLDLRYSLGFYVDDDQATIGDVIPGSAADAAGLAPGSHIIALNGYKWSKELLHDTLAAPGDAADGAGKLTLLIQKDDMFKSAELTYAGGERYPNLVRDPSSADLLSQIARPRTAATE